MNLISSKIAKHVDSTEVVLPALHLGQ